MQQKFILLALIQIIVISLWSECSKIGEYEFDAEPWAITVHNDIAYVACSTNGLLILDVSDPTSPELLCNYSTGIVDQYCFDVLVEGNYAFIAGRAIDLIVLAISDPANPVEVAQLDTPGDAYDMVLENGILYLPSYGYGMQILDVSDPTSPQLLSMYHSQSDTPCRISLSDQYLYLVSSWLEAEVIDVSDVTSPEFVGVFGWGDPAPFADIAASGGIVCATGYFYGVRIFDASDPADVEEVGFYDVASECNNLYLEDGLLILATQFNGLIFADVSDPTNPQTINMIDMRGAAEDVFIGDGKAYVVANGFGLQVFGVEDYENHDIVGKINTRYNATDVIVTGDVAYIALDDYGICSVDVSDPVNPSVLELEHYTRCTDLIEKDGIIYITTIGSVRLIDGVDPHDLHAFSICYTPGHALDMDFSGNYIFVADGEEGLQVVDVGDIEEPAIIGSCDTPDSARCIEVSNGYAYIADHSSGLQIVDVGDPENPLLIGSCDTPGTAQSLAVWANAAYVADGNGGLQIIDVSDPENPALRSTISNHETSDIACCYNKGDRLYVSDINWNEILIFNIASPLHPVLIDSYAWEYRVNDFYVSGSCLYTANGSYHGMAILDLEAIPNDDPQTVAPIENNLANHPNPFNPTTTISFSIAEDAAVRLEIFNIRGQLVKTMVEERLEAGIHEAVWNGKDTQNLSVASGIYFCRLKSGSKDVTKKMVLLK